MKYIKFVLILIVSQLSTLSWGLESDSKQPIYIEANSVTFDDKKGESIYIGDVRVVQGSMQLYADHLVVYSIDRKTDKIIATGNPLRFQQTPVEGKSDIHGESLRAEYYAADNRLILLQQALIWQGDNTYASERIEYDHNNDIVRAGQKSSGAKRVHVRLQPNDE